MKQQMVIYKTKPEHDAENERLLKAVFAEARAKQIDHVRYLVAKLPDDTYVHLVFHDAPDGQLPLTKLDAFKAYQADVRARLQTPPMTGDATIVGEYRMLRE